MSAVNLPFTKSDLVHSKMAVAITKNPYTVNPPLLRELDSIIVEYIKSEQFPNPNDKGTKEDWNDFLKDLRTKITLDEAALEPIDPKERKEVELSLPVKCFLKGIFYIGCGISMFGKYYNEEADATWFKKDVEIIYS